MAGLGRRRLNLLKEENPLLHTAVPRRHFPDRTEGKISNVLVGEEDDKVYLCGVTVGSISSMYCVPR